MRLANLCVYNKDKGISQIEGFIPTQIRRVRPHETACQILMCDDCYGTTEAPWIDIDMSYKHARYEIDRALVEMSEELVAAHTAEQRKSSGPRSDPDTDPRTQVGSGANPCPQCGGAPQANCHPVPPDKVRAIMTCPACNPDVITTGGPFWYAIGRGTSAEQAVAAALEKWNEVTRDPGAGDETLDRR